MVNLLTLKVEDIAGLKAQRIGIWENQADWLDGV
jgi:hypothetical protein